MKTSLVPVGENGNIIGNMVKSRKIKILLTGLLCFIYGRRGHKLQARLSQQQNMLLENMAYRRAILNFDFCWKY